MKATKKDHEIKEEWLGIAEDHASPQHEGPYTDPLVPHDHDSEYAESASAIRPKHGIQKTFPAGGKFGGSEGIGKERHGGKKVIK